eukprot:6213136-Pleurochrysis_carterae.AAC.1
MESRICMSRAQMNIQDNHSVCDWGKQLRGTAVVVEIGIRLLVRGVNVVHEGDHPKEPTARQP